MKPIQCGFCLRMMTEDREPYGLPMAYACNLTGMCKTCEFDWLHPEPAR